MIINNFSQAWAIYVLMLFYLAMHTELQPLNPLRKFVTIKLVVFFSFWQGLVITLLCSLEVLRPHSSWRTYTDRIDFSGGLQDTIICIEMCVAAARYIVLGHADRNVTGMAPSIAYATMIALGEPACV